MFRFTENFPHIIGSAAATGWLTSVLQLGGLGGSLAAIGVLAWGTRIEALIEAARSPLVS